MSLLRHLAPLFAGLFVLAGCGGGGSSSSPGAPETPSTPTSPADPVGTVRLNAQSGSAQHAALTWTGGDSSMSWRLERHRDGDAGGYALLAEIASQAGVWLDKGLAPDTVYGYRLSSADGSVLATATVRTEKDAALTTPAPTPTGTSMPVPISSAASSLQRPDSPMRLDLADGSLAASGTATLQPVAHAIQNGIGEGLSIVLPERPVRGTTLSLQYEGDEDVEDVLQDRIAMRQADGSWWLLPLAAHDASQRQLKVSVPSSLWVEQPTKAGPQISVVGTFVRVKAHKLVPASAAVPVRGQQRFVPVSVYRVVTGNIQRCNDLPEDELCVPTPMLDDATLPILNNRPGFEREWSLDGAGSLSMESDAGVTYTAPAQMPAANLATLRFRSVNNRTGQSLTLSAKIRIAEDAWVGQLKADGIDLSHYLANTYWHLDPSQSTGTRRVYHASGNVSLTFSPPECSVFATPDTVPLDQGRDGELIIDESVAPPRYKLRLSVSWVAAIHYRCPKGETSIPSHGSQSWSIEGNVINGRMEGSDNDLMDTFHWSLERVQVQ